MAIVCNLALLADSANADASGKLYVLGEFRYVRAATIPAHHGQFSVVARWEATKAEVRGRNNTLEIQIVDEDGNTLMPRTPPMPLTFSDIGEAARGMSEAKIILSMQGFPITRYGDYVFMFYVNGAANGTAKFYVTRPLPQAPPLPAAPNA